MNTLEALKTQKISATRTMNAIIADSSKQLPSRIQLIKAGVWIDSVKGSLDITVADLHEFKLNFDNGVGLPGGGTVGLPVDFSHEDWKGAAFWVKALEVEGDILWASQVEYTTKGKEALESGEYKCISPSFYPACLGQWYDPEDPTITARNVLVGAGLTNIPFFKGLTPIMASNSSGDDKNRNVIYINADTKGDIMDLTVIRAKNVADVTTEEKTFLEENKANLTADELVAFNIDQTPAEPVVPAAPVAEEQTEEIKEAVEVQASIKKGENVLVNAAAYNKLEAQVEASAKIIAGYERKAVEASVDAHIARGAIKADQKKEWADKLEADRSLETLLTTLPSNQVLADEIGRSGGEAKTATQEISDKVAEVMKADATLDVARATSQVRASNKDLAARYDEEIKG